VVIGGGVPAAFWVPLMAGLDGFHLHTVDLPGQGGTAPIPYRTDTLRSDSTAFLEGVLYALGIDRAPFVCQSMGGLWATWLALDAPRRVTAIGWVGCPAMFPDTSAPFPMRLGSIPPLARPVNRLQPPSPRQVNSIARMAGPPRCQTAGGDDRRRALPTVPYGPVDGKKTVRSGR